jgi:hypothetical protein
MPEMREVTVKPITKYLGLAVILAGGLVVTTMNARETKSQFSLNISTASSQFIGGDHIVLDITYHNASTARIPWMASGNAETRDDIIVTHEGGSPVQKTHYGECLKLHGREAELAGCSAFGYSGNALFFLEPGGDAQDSSSISDLYQITQPGRYRIFVRSKYPPEIGVGIATSNVVTITIKG